MQSHQHEMGSGEQMDTNGTAASTSAAESAIGIGPPNGIRHDAESAATQIPPSIQEGKQKAMAVLNAAQSDSSVEQEPIRANSNATNTPEPTPVTNGVTPSRKRSRSGTRITHVEVKNPEAPRLRQGGDFQHTYEYRDQTHAAALAYDTSEHVKLVRRVLAEHRHYDPKQTRPESIPYNRTAHIIDNFGPGYLGFGNGTTHLENNEIRLVYPKDRKKPGRNRARELTIERKRMGMQSEQDDELVPIRLDVEWDKYRLRDTFTWNLHDRVVSPELFAERMVEDFKLPPEHGHHLAKKVEAAIREQVAEYHPQLPFKEEALDPHLPYSAYKDDEMRISIKLNITIGQNCLEDQFEWDINNPENSPEDFARKMTTELCLSGEFATAIAHSIREQCQLFTRSLYITNHPFDGRPIEDAELRSSFLPSPLPASFRPYQQAKEFTPYYFPMNDAEIEKTELSLSREERRQKRSTNRRGGPALPDLKDRRRTIRRLVTSSVLPDSAPTFNESRIFKFSASSLGRGRKSGYARDGLGDDSSDSGSEISEPESVAIPQHLLAGTARTRNMRGAASAAQAAIRGSGRADTPDFMLRDEVRTSGRRAAANSKDYREDSSVDDNAPSTLILKLKIHPVRFRALMRDLRTGPSRPDTLLTTTPNSRRSHSGTPGLGTPGLHSSMPPPPTTPGRQGSTSSAPQQHNSTTTGGANPLHPHAAQIGRVDALGPPSEEFPVVSPTHPPVFCSFHFLSDPLFDAHANAYPPAATTVLANRRSHPPPTDLPGRRLRRHNALYKGVPP